MITADPWYAALQSYQPNISGLPDRSGMYRAMLKLNIELVHIYLGMILTLS